MDVSPQEIDRIVSRVLERLRPAGAVAPGPTVVKLPVANPAPATTETTTTSALVLSDRVISASLLAERARGSRLVRVHPKAILTPSAKDWLRENKVEIVRADAEAASSKAARWLAILSTTTKATQAAFEQNPGGFTWARALSGVWKEAAAQATSSICRGEADVVVVVTSQPDAVACLANRQAAVRAAAVHTVGDVGELLSTLGPNVFAVHPRSRSVYEFKLLLQAIAAGGTPRIPSGF